MVEDTEKEGDEILCLKDPGRAPTYGSAEKK